MVMQHSKAVIDFNLNNIENVPKFCAKFYSYFETPIFENYIIKFEFEKVNKDTFMVGIKFFHLRAYLYINFLLVVKRRIHSGMDLSKEPFRNIEHG